MEVPSAGDPGILFRVMSGLRSLLKRVFSPFLQAGLKRYYRKPRPYTYDGIKVIVHPDVFPPHLTLSTKILLDFVETLPLENRRFLELGCGSGIISLLAARNGALTTASDINETALDYLRAAAEENNLKVNCVLSDLFTDIEEPYFDYIVINPPYYPKKPESVKEQAWFCGENFEYFEKLFTQLPEYLNAENQTFMILSEDCDVGQISNIATKNDVSLVVERTMTRWGERNTIFRLERG